MLCPSGTWRRGAGCSSETGEGYECIACSSCGGGLHELTDCNATVDRTCQSVGEERYSAAGDNTERTCFNAECADGTFRTRQRDRPWIRVRVLAFADD